MRQIFRSQQGFTLIEVVIAMLILAIVARFAISNYAESINRAKRNQAQVAVMGLAQALERYYTANNSYAGAANATNVPTLGFPVVVPPTAPSAADSSAVYTLTAVIPAGGASYTITATRIAGHVMANDKCGDFTITNTGAQGIANQATGVQVRDCWK